MKILVALILPITLYAKTDVKKIFLPYEIVIGSADLVAEGEIVSVSNGFYKFKITDFLKNRSKKIITVNMFTEWNCDERIVPVEKGQRLLLFLSKSKGELYEIINGSSGELFVDNVPGDFSQDYDFRDYNDIKKGIKLFVKAFDYCGNLYPIISEKQSFKRLLSELEITNMELSSMFFKSIRRNIVKKYHIK